MNDWLEQVFSLDLEVKVVVEWKYRIDKDRYYMHVMLGDLEITDALSDEERDHVETCVLDAIKIARGEYEDRG